MTDPAPLTACRAMVATTLSELCGERLVTDAEVGRYGFREGSAWVTVRVAEAGGAPVITTRSALVEGAEPTPELLHHLLEEAARPPFAAFGLDARDAIVVEHVMPGAGATPDQLRSVVQAVAAFADRADDELVARFGGIRMTDPRPVDPRPVRVGGT